MKPKLIWLAKPLHMINHGRARARADATRLHCACVQVCSEVITMNPGWVHSVAGSCMGKSARYVMIKRTSSEQAPG